MFGLRGALEHAYDQGGLYVFFSSRWSVGALAQLAGYRYATTEASVSSVSYGLLPTLALAFTLN